MLGELTIDKASMNMSYFLKSIQIVGENTKISREDFISKMSEFLRISSTTDNGKENRTPYNKSKLPRYFGFIDVDTDNNKNEFLVLTNRGKKLIGCISEKNEASADERYYVDTENISIFRDLIFESIIFDSFGKNNCGAERSNTDIEPPKIIFKAILDLKRATSEEIFYIIYGLNRSLFLDYDSAISQVKKNRNNGKFDYSKEMSDWGITNIVNDCKIVKIFTDKCLSLLVSEKDRIVNKEYYYFSNFIDESKKKQIKKMNYYYQPLRMMIYSNDYNKSLLNDMLKNGILGRVSDSSYVFECEKDTVFFNNASTFTPYVLEKALFKAFNNQKKNVFITINGVSENELKIFLGKYYDLFIRRINDFKDDFHGFSINSMFDANLYNYLLNSKYAKKLLTKGMIQIPANLHLIGAMNMEKESQGEDFDFVFTRVLVEGNNNAKLATKINNESRIYGGSNILLYGVPGSGKSYLVENVICNKDDGWTKERVVFHPDYTYSDFVGQILPQTSTDADGKKSVTYEYVAGPFTRILKDACENPDKKYALIIEELNRGNAPAIFGEIFQLLDRSSHETDNGPEGTGMYDITNSDVANYVFNDPKKSIRIPSNLWLIATMNTSDQNVFTLDTAFQRRWQMRLIENKFIGQDKRKMGNRQILDTGITWEKFCITVNKKILCNLSSLSSSEDKRLGVFFIVAEDLKGSNIPYTSDEYESLLNEDECSDKKRLLEIENAINADGRFPQKVIKYLWDDAFKYCRENVFETGKYTNLEEIVGCFVFNVGRARFDFFKEDLVKELYGD